MSEGEWSLIESDPGVFSSLVHGFGATGIQFEELWGITREDFDGLPHLHGLVFLFRWTAHQHHQDPPSTAAPPNVFFARQVTNNACATQAVINLLMNCSHPDIELGPTLAQLKEFCQFFDPQMKGLALTNSQLIRSVHNSFARQTLFEYDGKSDAKDDEVYHFVTYVPVDGRLYELDGLKPGPIDLGEITPEKDWIDMFRDHITDRIVNRYKEGEIHFNLMALVSDLKVTYERELAKIVKQVEESGMETDAHKCEIQHYKNLIASEEEKRKKIKAEIARRKHNYLPFIIELLKILAREGKLMPLYEQAKQKASQKTQKSFKI